MVFSSVLFSTVLAIPVYTEDSFEIIPHTEEVYPYCLVQNQMAEAWGIAAMRLKHILIVPTA